MATLNDFPPADMVAWRRLVEHAREGLPFESLISRTFEALEIAPLYPRATTERPRAFRQAPGPWKIAQRIDHPDPATANYMARIDLDGGADALALTVAGSPAARGFGTAIHTTADLDRTLERIALDLVPLRVDAGDRSLEIARHLRSLAQDRRLGSAALDIDIGHDPIGSFARSGILSSTPDSIGRDAAATSRRLRDFGFCGRLFQADGRPYHEAGAGEAQELACVVATGVAYLRLLDAAGVALREARDEIGFLLAADADLFATLGKFRALRRLWARIECACGLEPKPIRLHAETAFRMMTRYDSRVNVLRSTAASFAAAIGGADTITVLPHTSALGLPNEAARRLGRNLQLVLVHEAKVAQVSDPAAGSGAFETLTDEFCEKAWALLQRIEQQGGMIAGLAAGLPQAAIAEVAAARRAAIACRRREITGTSAFPDLGEATAAVLDVQPTSPDRPIDAVAHCPPLPAERDALPFERLRAAADAFLARTGARPRVFVLPLGSAPVEIGAGSSLRDLFAVAGIETSIHAGSGTRDVVAAAFAGSGCEIACIHVSSVTRRDEIAALVETLRKAGATALCLVGLAREAAAGLELGDIARLDEDCDLVAALRDALARCDSSFLDVSGRHP